MEATPFYLSMILADANLSIGAAGAERLSSSIGRLGFALVRSVPGESAPAIGAAASDAPLAITVDYQRGTITFALTGDGKRIRAG